MVTKNVTCSECGYSFDVDDEIKDEQDKIYVNCPKCNTTLEIDATSTTASWLPCLPFTGPEKSCLAGWIRMRGRVPEYVNYAGQSLSREEAIKEVGLAEVLYWDSKHGYKHEEG